MGMRNFGCRRFGTPLVLDELIEYLQWQVTVMFFTITPSLVVI